jgi:hypothetical protein
MNIRYRHIHFALLFCAVCIVFITGCKKSGDYSGPVNGFKRYPYERMHVTYEYSGDIRGSEEFYFSDYGKNETRSSKIDIMSSKGIQSSENAAITKLAEVYDIDFMKKTIIHDRSSTLDSLYHLEGNALPISQQYLESEMKRNFFHNVGADIIAGKPASRWERENGLLTVWMWNCLMLRKRVNSPDGSFEMNVKNIDSLWTVDTSRFSLPSGFSVTEAQNKTHAPTSN